MRLLWFACAIVSDGIESVCVLHICPFADMVYLNILKGQLVTHVGEATFLDRRRPIGPRVGDVMFLDQRRSVGALLYQRKYPL